MSQHLKRGLLASAGLALCAAIAAFAWQGVGYRFIDNGMVFAGNGSAQPLLGFEPTQNAGYDTTIQRVSGGGLNISPGFADWVRPIGATACQMTAATTAFSSGPAIVRSAANNTVLSGTTNTTAGTITVDCNLDLASRLTSGRGVTVSDVELLYGQQTTALASIATATVATVSYPAVGGAAGATVAAAGGSYTVTPGSLVVATNTTGLCTPEKIAFGTPIQLNTDLQRLTLEQVFTTAGTTATTLQVCGALVHYTNNVY